MTVKIPQALFLGSSSKYKEIPVVETEEYCILGRSNVGKSSFINHVFNNKKLARVSSRPGKTILANMFEINKEMLWVDLPGYGYAKLSKTEKKRLTQLIADYCTRRENLDGIIWLLDIRHPGSTADKVAFQWFASLGIPVLPVLTKADKLSRNKIAQARKEYCTIFPFPKKPLYYSIMQEHSRHDFWDAFEKWRGPRGGDPK